MKTDQIVNRSEGMWEQEEPGVDWGIKNIALAALNGWPGTEKLPRGSRAVLRIINMDEVKVEEGEMASDFDFLHYWRIRAFSILWRKLMLSSEWLRVI